MTTVVDKKVHDLAGELARLQRRIAEVETINLGREEKEFQLRELADAAQKRVQMLDKILSTSPDQIYMYDEKGRYLYASLAGAQVKGLKKEEFIGKTWRELGFDKSLAGLHNKRRQIFATGKSMTDEEVYPTVSGERRHYESILTPVFDDNGKVEAVICIARDVTRRKRLEEELRLYREHLEQLVAHRTTKLNEINEQLIEEVKERKLVQVKLEHINRVLLIVHNINHLILKRSSPVKLLQDVCKLLTEDNTYSHARVIQIDEAGQFVRATAAGKNGNRLALVKIVEQGKLPNCCQKAIVRRRTVVTENRLETCHTCPLFRHTSQDQAFTVRLEYHGVLYGILHATLRKIFAADKEEQALFELIAEDIAFALHHMGVEKERRRVEKIKAAQATALAVRAQELQRSRERIVTVQESVRKELAQRLHGEVQNRLIVVLHRLRELQRELPAGKQSADAEYIYQTLQDTLEKNVRPISHRLFPSILRRGLTPALQSLGDELESRMQVEIHIDESLIVRERETPNFISESVRLAIYRIAEEALTNVAKYSQASKAGITQNLVDGWLHLIIKDNGQGFDIESASGNFGLMIMEDYARVLGGVCTIRSLVGKGTEVTADIPLAMPAAKSRKSASS